MFIEEGDIVKIREDLELNEDYGGASFVSSMEKYLGAKLEVEEVLENGNRFLTDAFWWTFTPEMVEEVYKKKEANDVKEEEEEEGEEAPTFEIGDKVKIRENIKAGQMYNGIPLLNGMAEKRGTVTKVTSADRNINIYNLADVPYGWSGSMLEKVEDTPEFKVGDKVRLRDDLESFRDYGDITYIPGMKDLEDRLLEVETIDRVTGDVELKEDPIKYIFSTEMLEKVDTPKFEVGDKITYKKLGETFFGKVIVVSDEVGELGESIGIKVRFPDGTVGHRFASAEDLELREER